jgi:outer membrane receptor protein involved in Fe transport
LAQEIPTTGHIAGRVVSTDTGRPLPFANVILFKLASEQDTLGTQITGTFALCPDGDYRLSATPGLYRVMASHISHAHVNFIGIEVVAGKTTPLDILLSLSTTMILQTIQVRAKVERRTEAAVLTRRKESEVVSDAVSIEQIKKTADSNAADALQRVSGLSLVDDKYVFVRGLGERYSSTQINGSTVGSPEPNKRVLPLDMIPAVLIDNMEILKTYMPDQPAEFGGGVVKINTRDFPGKRIWAISVGSGAIVGTTGGPFHAYDGGKLDFLGFDDGTRALPDLIQQWAPDRRISFWSPLSGKGFKPDQIAAMGQSFSRVWTTQSRGVWPAYKVNGAYGDQFSIGGNPLGFIVGGIWANTFDAYDEVQRHYKPGAEEGTLQILSDYDATTSKAKAHLGMVGSLSYRAGENTGIYFRTLYNHQAEDDARCYEGPNDDHGKYMRNTRLRFIERGLWASNLGITHDFPQLYGGRFEWRVNYSHATRDEPDRRQYTYERHGSDQAGYSWQLSNRSLAGGFTRMFGVLDERERGVELSWTMPLFLGGESEGRLKLGYFGSFKNRESTYRRFAFKPPSQHAPDMSMSPDSLMTEELIGGTKDTFRIVEQTQGTDHYEAQVDINAGYLVLHVPLSRRLRAAGGVRVESWDQAVETFDPFNSAQPPVVAMLGETDYLPALNLTYTINPKMNLRAGYSATISRPDIRELTPFEMHDWESGYSEVGNPESFR